MRLYGFFPVHSSLVVFFDDIRDFVKINLIGSISHFYTTAIKDDTNKAFASINCERNAVGTYAPGDGRLARWRWVRTSYTTPRDAIPTYATDRNPNDFMPRSKDGRGPIGGIPPDVIVAP